MCVCVYIYIYIERERERERERGFPVAYLACLIEQFFFVHFFMAVIRRAPHEFKIACLEVNNKTQTSLLDAYLETLLSIYGIISYLQDIRKLFPSDYNPFYAGFGNRDTDELSYKKMGIPKGKIFIINPKVFIPNLCFSLFSFSSILVH